MESNIQKTIGKVRQKHGEVIGDTSAMRHATIAFSCIGDIDLLEKTVKETVPILLKKHGKKTFSLRVQQYMFCPGPAPLVGLTPKKDSVDYKFFTELQATMLMNPAINRAHPDYKGNDKITDPSKLPAGFADLKAAIDGGASLEDAAHKWMWPHISAFRLDDKENIGSFGNLKREAMVEKYGWIEHEEVDVEIPIRVVGVSLETENEQKLRLEINV
jgi:hypothetical protein